MNIIFCLVLSYLLLGIISTIQALKANPLDSPGWVRNPNFILLFLAVFAWPIAIFVNTDPSIPIMRAFMFNLIDIILKIVLIAAYIWGCFALLNIWFDSSAVIISLGLVLLIVSMPIMLPVISIVSVPISIILAIPIHILFPMSNR